MRALESPAVEALRALEALSLADGTQGQALVAAASGGPADGGAGRSTQDAAGSASAGDVAAEVAGAGAAPEGRAVWVVEARRHPTVEAWFHSLIRGHFKGNLKVRVCVRSVRGMESVGTGYPYMR